MAATPIAPTHATAIQVRALPIAFLTKDGRRNVHGRGPERLRKGGGGVVARML